MSKHQEEPIPVSNQPLIEVTGFFFTHYDCPNCIATVIEVEGDTRGEEIECDVCGIKFTGS